MGVLGVGALIAVSYLLLSPFKAPLSNLGTPVLDIQQGARRHVIYSFPGEYWSYAPTADSILHGKGYKRINNDMHWYTHSNGSTVIVYPGKWKPWSSQDGMVDTFKKGWVTVTVDSPPNPWKLWQINRELNQRRAARAAKVAGKTQP